MVEKWTIQGFILCLLFFSCTDADKNVPFSVNGQGISPAYDTLNIPYKKTSFRPDSCGERRRGAGQPRMEGEILVFDGAMDGNRQVDPQIAVGKNHIFHATNSGLTIFDKEGNYIDGVRQTCFRGGIDPKLFYDPHNDVFGFDLWQYWDREDKPVHISVSASGDPTQGWNVYSVPSPDEVDGGSIGFSSQWVGYTFPGGEENTFVMRLPDMKNGVPTMSYHFTGNLGHPVTSQDDTDVLYFLALDSADYVISAVAGDENGKPLAYEVARSPHGLTYLDYPPQSPQKGTEQLTASGDRNPKNVVLNNGYLWFSHTVNRNGKAAVQWHQIKLDGTTVQSGSIYDPNTNYIQTSLAVNKKNDVLIGFQETNENMYISPRYALHMHTDESGTTRPVQSLGEGTGHTDGVAWGDYSGSTWDGSNHKDLWTVQSRANEEGKGETVIARVRVE